MRHFVILLSLFVLSSCGSVRYFIVRHAEKAAPGMGGSTDVPLTPAGEARAAALKEELTRAKIGYVFSTNTQRTKSTARPTADLFSLPINIYGPAPDSAFIAKLKKLDKNTLIVGHSNTVDDIVNKLCGQPLLQDLGDNEYDNLFVVTKKRGKFTFLRMKYGYKE